jgi:transcriptional regulator with XRE-family HTH domain
LAEDLRKTVRHNGEVMMKERGFGEKLKGLRIKSGKSQGEVVREMTVMFREQIRMSQSTLSALEQRETAPREDVLDILCKYYDVPIAYFFDRSDSNVSKAINVKGYIEALRIHTPASDQRFAHSSEKRSTNDEVERSLLDMPDYDEDDEFLDT